MLAISTPIRISPKLYLYPLLLSTLILLHATPSFAVTGLGLKTYGKIMGFVGKTVATTGLLLMCSTHGCKPSDQPPSPQAVAPPAVETSISSLELQQALHNDYHDQEVLFVNDFGQLTEGHAYRNPRTDWFWVDISGGEVPVYEHEMVGILAPDHEYVGTSLLLPPLDGTGKNLLRTINATIDRVYTTRQLVFEEGARGKQSFVRDIPTGYAITVYSGALREDHRQIAFHLPYSLLIRESDIYGE